MFAEQALHTLIRVLFLGIRFRRRSMTFRINPNPRHNKFGNFCFYLLIHLLYLKIGALKLWNLWPRRQMDQILFLALLPQHCSWLFTWPFFPSLPLGTMPAEYRPHGDVGRVSRVNTTISGYNTMLPATLGPGMKDAAWNSIVITFC